MMLRKYAHDIRGRTGGWHVPQRNRLITQVGSLCGVIVRLEDGPVLQDIHVRVFDGQVRIENCQDVPAEDVVFRGQPETQDLVPGAQAAVDRRMTYQEPFNEGLTPAIFIPPGVVNTPFHIVFVVHVRLL